MNGTRGTLGTPGPPGTRQATPHALLWTIRLRFGAIAGQLVTIAGVHFVMGIALPLLPLLLLIAAALSVNVVCLLWLRGGRAVPAQLLPALMVLDVLHLTALLYFTGGPFNPFSFLYLVLIALSAVVMPPRFTWSLVALSVACSGVLFLRHEPLPMQHDAHAAHAGHAVHPGALSHAAQMNIHLYGMWVAFSVAASFIVYFLMRITRELSLRDAELQAARSRALQKEKLASLATLAAGAAHELATPLSTIAVIAKELERQLGPGQMSATPAAAIDDVRLIRTEVDRCRRVLDQMARDAGHSTGESMVAMPVRALLSAAQAGLSATPPVRVELGEAVAGLSCRVPPRALAQALHGLIKNAQEATLEALSNATAGMDAAPGVELTARREADELVLSIRDAGTGMQAEVAARAGEPFFTTKAPGRGMGLGLFLCRAVLESLGGSLHLEPQPAGGTLARVRLPLDGSRSQRRTGAPGWSAEHAPVDAAQAQAQAV